MTRVAGVWLVVIALSSCARAAELAITSCVYVQRICGCKTNKGMINLKDFGPKGLSTGEGSSGQTFYWNPCRDFTLHSVTAACIQHFASGVSFDCGLNATVQSSVIDGKAVFHMESAYSANTSRKSEVACICASAGEKLKLISENPVGTYKYLMVSPVLFIVIHGRFACLICVYLVVGMIVQVVFRKARGREIIPHVNFWTSLPSLIANGMHFTFTCGSSSDDIYRQW
ncbi:cation-dependent mannose-6-phosphate receptor [Plakobranchus ocellatus]|uniref:Cation-dependent mannose-6-phosphate receptor n=1 Tax=Plakobranchus ocellatus TaxID=259542 RepID=A0AAV4BF66_9GAST|nr:cation-dependent mannose-6-phosphate receptor [Plakobranchus ocellatus]